MAAETVVSRTTKYKTPGHLILEKSWEAPEPSRAFKIIVEHLKTFQNSLSYYRVFKSIEHLSIQEDKFNNNTYYVLLSNLFCLKQFLVKGPSARSDFIII